MHHIFCFSKKQIQYKQNYRLTWEKIDLFKGWLSQSGNDTRGKKYNKS